MQCRCKVSPCHLPLEEEADGEVEIVEIPEEEKRDGYKKIEKVKEEEKEEEEEIKPT